MSKIVIVDYGAGNLMSIKNMLRKAGDADALISNEHAAIANAKKLILPGVGHFDYGMKKLKESGLVDLLTHKVMMDKIPVLGICLGAQLMTQSSEEGNELGLGWVDAKTLAFDQTKLPKSHKIPHMGWNEISQNKATVLFKKMPDQPRFYFVHSYHLAMKNKEDIWLTAEYGYQFCAAFQHDNIFACQFHPEKSHQFGLQLMKNFVDLQL